MTNLLCRLLAKITNVFSTELRRVLSRGTPNTQTPAVQRPSPPRANNDDVASTRRRNIATARSHIRKRPAANVTESTPQVSERLRDECKSVDMNSDFFR